MTGKIGLPPLIGAVMLIAVAGMRFALGGRVRDGDPAP